MILCRFYGLYRPFRKDRFLIIIFFSPILPLAFHQNSVVSFRNMNSAKAASLHKMNKASTAVHRKAAATWLLRRQGQLFGVTSQQFCCGGRAFFYIRIRNVVVHADTSKAVTLRQRDELHPSRERHHNGGRPFLRYSGEVPYP